MRNLVLILLFPLLTGCLWNAKNENLPAVITETNTEYLIPEVNISSELLKECRDQETLNKSDATLADILINVQNNTIIYNECRDKQRTLSKVVTRSLNLKDNE